MAHVHRFYAPELRGPSAQYTLTDEEAHHAARVARVREGDQVVLFNGQGEQWTGCTESVDKRTVAIALEEHTQVDRTAPSLTLCAAMLDVDKTTETIIRRATDLGVSRIVFYRAERSQKQAGIRDKWRRLLVESAKQCGQLWLPTLEAVPNIEALEGIPAQRFILSLDDAPNPFRSALNEEDAAILVGPEGDFTERERAYAIDDGWRPVSLGDTVFKADVAVIVAAAIIQYEWGHLGPLT